jgi:hypothetical protein
VEAGAEADVVHVDADKAHGAVIVSGGGDNHVDVLDDALEGQIELVHSSCHSSRARSILFMKRMGNGADMLSNGLTSKVSVCTHTPDTKKIYSKEPHHLGGARAVLRCGFGSRPDVKHT